MALPMVVLDDRRRTSLAKVGRRTDFRYLAEEHPDGSVLLTPVMVLATTDYQELRQSAPGKPLRFAE